MPEESKPLTIPDLPEFKAQGRKVTVLTCYDALFARLLDGLVDVLLVGDSLNQVLAGHDTTLSATLDQMIYHAQAVRRGARQSLVFVDLPFLSYQVTVEEALRNAGRVMKETGANGVKLEGGEHMAETIRALVRAGIPVMGHIGLTPQSVHQLGGYRVQGRERAAADRLRADARFVEEAGACSVVLELVPAVLAAEVSRAISIPTIGIGAGPGCDGQVLVLHDMLGLNEVFAPKFLKKYADLAETVREAARRFAEDVRTGKYPGKEHSFE
jgi:3-methyl-2-oxobutanoate hydroxymethyltransferase